MPADFADDFFCWFRGFNFKENCLLNFNLYKITGYQIPYYYMYKQFQHLIYKQKLVLVQKCILN